jgi:hypothetical protein
VLDIEVRRDDLRTTRVVDAEPGAGDVTLHIDRFGLTANNVTYGVFGDAMSYWAFFPASEEGWGRIPVWGYGDVVASEADGVAVGERFYGYFPMSSEHAMTAEAGGGGFTAVDEHRRALPPVYNRYLRTEPGAPHADEALLLRPLFGTSWLIAEHLQDASGAVALSSASSKTAYGVAHLLRGEFTVIGLTSPGNRGYVESLGLYDRVLTYDEIAGGLGDEDLVYVDLSGDGAVREAVHRAAGDRLRQSIAVGATHWEEMASGSGELPGPTPEFFFAPAHIERLTAELGAAELQRRMGEASAGFFARAGAYMEIERDEGPGAVERVWRSLVDGDADPRRGYVLSL